MFLYRLARFLISPFYWLSLRIRNRHQLHIFHEKMGRPTEGRPKGDLIWIHVDDVAASIGVIRSIISNLSGATILLTHNKPLKKPFYGAICQQAPIDQYLAIKRFLNFWEPLYALRLGAELRPNQLARLKKMKIPSFLINADISDWHYRLMRLAGWLFKKTVRNLTFIWALDNRRTLRFANLGAHDIKPMDQIHGNNPIREIMQKIKTTDWSKSDRSFHCWDNKHIVVSSQRAGPGDAVEAL